MYKMLRAEEDCLLFSTAPLEALRAQHVVRCPEVTFINAVQMSLAGGAFQVNSFRG